MLYQRKYTEVYSCVGSMVLGSPMGVLNGLSIGDGTGWEELIPVGMAPGEKTVASLGD